MPRRKKDEQPQEEIKVIKTPPLVKGMKDILPADGKYWDFVEAEVLRTIRDSSYNRMVTPVLEKYELFNHTLFKQSNKLDNEVFSFVDRGEKLAMRPEVTASIARAFIDHNMVNQPMPQKIYYWGPVFRQGKIEPHKLRQFTQVGFEIIGDPAPAIDAELVITAHYLFKNLGLNIQVKLNSMGCPSCRPNYMNVLTQFLKSKRSAIPADLRKMISKDPMRVLRCNTNRCERVFEDAPLILDYLCDDCRQHLFRVLEYLDELKIAYELDPRFTRTYDYYIKTIFEIRVQNDNPEEEKLPLAGGGRYDTMMEMLGGEPTSAAGFAFGLERAINEMKNQKVEIPPAQSPDVYVTQIGELARQKAFAFFEKLRKQGFNVRGNFSKASLKAQLDVAKKLDSKLILILGQKEVTEGTVLLRDMESGNQEVVNIDKTLEEIKKRLADKKS